MSSCGHHHKARAIAVRRNLRIARIELAAIHIVVVPRLILIGKEIDAVASNIPNDGSPCEGKSGPIKAKA